MSDDGKKFYYCGGVNGLVQIDIVTERSYFQKYNQILPLNGGQVASQNKHARWAKNKEFIIAAYTGLGILKFKPSTDDFT